MGLPLVVFVALAVVGVSGAPSTNATCVTQLWSLNSIKQSPCLVSAYLSSQCTTTNSWSVWTVGPGSPYTPPNGTSLNICQCSSVTWNLLSACSICQGGPAGSWSEWIADCPTWTVSVGRFPMDLPQGVMVPKWAYYNFTGSGVFDAALAQQQTGAESSAAVISAPTSTACSTNPPAPSNTGAIVGGVVGGISGLALLAFIAFLVLRKSKHEPPESEPYSPTAVQNRTMSEQMGIAQTSPKLYNPDDPTTYPRENHGLLRYSLDSHPQPHGLGRVPNI